MADRKTTSDSYWQTNRQTGTQRHSAIGREIDKQTDRNTTPDSYWQRDRQTDRQEHNATQLLAER